MADVVTGKPDVRQVSLRLPDESKPDAAEGATDVSVEIEPSEKETAV